MLKINIADAEFEYLEAQETEERYNGAFRRTMTVTCAADAIGMDDLNAMLTEENLASIIMHNDNAGTDDEGNTLTATSIHEGYVLKLACGVSAVLTQPETPDTPAVYEDRLIFKVGKRTYIEQKLHELGL